MYAVLHKVKKIKKSLFTEIHDLSKRWTALLETISTTQSLKIFFWVPGIKLRALGLLGKPWEKMTFSYLYRYLQKAGKKGISPQFANVHKDYRRNYATFSLDHLNDSE